MVNEELIYLESDEEITTIIDRLRSVTASSVRLVVPKGGLVLQSLVSLKLLKREADRLGRNIALVTSDGVGLNLGEQANITVFAKPKDVRPVFEAKIEKSAVRSQQSELPISSEESEVGTDQSSQKPENRVQDNEETNVDSPIAQDEGAALTSETISEEDQHLNPDTKYRIPDTDSGIHVHHYTTEDSQPDSVSGQEQQVVVPQKTTSLLQAAKKHGQPNRRFRPGRWLLGLVSLALLGFVGYLTYMELAPRATLALTVATEPFQQKVTLQAGREFTTVDQENARIPATLVEAEVSLEQSLPATGKKQVGTKATATLSLSNYWDSNPQSFPTGTSFVASDGTSFVSTAAATIPGATTTLKEGKVVTTPGKTNVLVEATTVGSEANQKTGRFTIPSLPEVRQDKIYGEATAATAGGSSREVTVVSSADLTNLESAARAAANEQGKASLTEKISDGRLLTGAYELLITLQKADVLAGAEAETVTLTITGSMKGLVVKDQDVTTATLAVITKAIPSGRKHISSPADTITTNAQNLNLEAGTVDILAVIMTKTAIGLDEGTLVSSVVGQSLTAARATLLGTTGVVTVTIAVRPRWLKNLPKREPQISLTIDYASENPPAATSSPVSTN
jgi:hypothetical protein